MEIWDLTGCGVKGSWTKRGLYLWYWYWKEVYYRESLISIPQIPVEEDDCVESDLQFSVDEFYP
ncbi:hypothetical protein Dimus_032033, partial [Dionaea muscipula]